MRRLDRLVLATHNPGKVIEIKDLLEPYGISAMSAGELGLAVPDETEDTFVGNARLKAHAAARTTGEAALSDDSGIEVEALGGAPGVHTADWAETAGGRDFVLAMTRLRERLEGVEEPWAARFCCTLCLAWPDGADEIFVGAITGRVVWPMRGTNGFGFDPVFVPEGNHRTFAEMQPEEKHAIDHRARAFAAFARQL